MQSVITTLDEFTKAYIDAALWSSSAEISECNGCDFETLNESGECPKCGGKLFGSDLSMQDRDLDINDIDPATLEKIKADCLKFQADMADDLESAECTRGSGEYQQLEQAGHDFWLTRNGHGAGFWDGDWSEPAATVLTNAAKSLGEFNLYLTENKEEGGYTIHGQ